MVFKDGGIKVKKALQGRTDTHNNKSAGDDDCRRAGDIRQRKVYGSSPVAAKKEGRMLGHARPSSSSCQDACKQSPVGVKLVKASCVGKIVKSSSGSPKFMKFSSESRKHEATPSSSSSSGGSRVSADLNSKPRRRLGTEGGSESSRKQVCPYNYCSLNVRDRPTQLSFKRSLGSRRGSASSAAGDINSSPRRGLSTEGNPEHTRKKRCPYTYCSLNDRDRVVPLSFKRSRAPRRSLMKKGFNATLDDSEAAGNQSREQGLSPPMPNCHVDYMTEENTLMPENDTCNGCLDCPDDSVSLSAESGKDRGLGCAVSACKSTECDHVALEFNGKPPLEGIKISESLLDGSGCESSADDLLKQLEEYKGGTLSPGIDVSACDIAEINCDSYPQSEDSDPHCFVQIDALGILCGGHTEPDRPVDESLLESAASIKGELKEESGSDAGNLTDEPVSEISANDCLEQFVGCEDDANSGQGNDVYDYGCTMDNEPLCLVQADTLGKQCVILANSDRLPGGSVNDNGASCKQEVKDEPIKIAESLLNGSDSEFCVDDSRQFAECYEDGQDGNYRSDSDVSAHESIECNDFDYGVVKDEHIKIAEDLLNGSNSEFGVDDSRPFAEGNEDGDDHDCRSASDISAHELIDSDDYDYGGHTEPDRPVDESLLESTASIKGEVKEESGSDAGNLTDEPVSVISASDCLEQFVGCKDDANSGQGNDVYDYGCTMDNEPLCLVQADTLGKQCVILANSDRLPGGSVNDNGASCKQEVKDEPIKIAESLLNGSDSELCVDDSRQFAECYEDGQDGNYRSDSDVSAHESIECNDYDYGVVKDEHIKIAEDLLNGSNSEFGVDDSRPFAKGNEGGDDHDCRSASDISAHELIESNDYDYGDGKDSALCCSVQLGAPGIQCSSHEESNRPLDGSPFDLCANPLSEVEEENINIAAPDSSVDRSSFELSASPNSKKDGKDEEHTNVEESIVDHLVSEICANDSIKQLSEFDDGQSDCLRTDTDIFAHESKEYNGYDCDHHMDAKPWHSIQVDNFEMHCSNQTEPDSALDGWPLEFPVSSENEVEEDYYKIIAESGLNGPVAEFSPCSRNQVKEYGNIAEENGNENQQVKFRRGRCGHHFSEPISEAEKVNLRHQLIPERKAAEEWMIDYALIKIVNELSPLRKSKVEMLVEAFESVMPLNECETNDLEHGRTNFSHIWPMQACN